MWLRGHRVGFRDSDRHVVTNWHVVVNDVTPVLRFRNGAIVTGRVVGWSEDPDIAVIELPALLDVHLDWADTSDLTEGAEPASLGYPLPEHDFSVTPGSILSFIREGGRSVALRTDASLDRGSSGGPALTAQGTVAGVVTQIDLNLEGFQFVPLVVTYDALVATVDGILDEPNRPDAQCAHPLLAGPPSPAGGPTTDGDYPDPYDPFWAVVLSSMAIDQFSVSDALNRSIEYWESANTGRGAVER